MATRFYFGQLITYPALAFSATWSAAGSTPARLLARTTKGRAALNTAPKVGTATETTAAVLNKQNVQLIARLGTAQAISGTVKGYALFSESDAAQDCRVQCEIRVISETGTIRGTLLASDTGALSSELTLTTPTNRRIPLLAASNTLTLVNAQAGDYLVIEIGHRTHVASGTSYNVTLTWHDDPATGDLPEDEASTDATLAPWIEFSQTLDLSGTFDGFTPGLSTVPGVDTQEMLPFALPAPSVAPTPLAEFNTQAISYELVNRVALQAADVTDPTYFQLKVVPDLLTTPLYNNPIVPAIFGAVGVYNKEALPLSVLNQKVKPELLAEFNTKSLQYTLIDPTNRDVDINALGTGGGADLAYVNRAYDNVAGSFVKWITGEPDIIGAAYPGPGVFGVTTADYVVERRSVL